MHIAIDDATRLAYAEVLNDEKATTAIGFLRRAVAFYASYGITVRELLTDNGSPYRATVTRSPVAPWASATSAPGRGATDQRQSRTLHPHPAGRLGLRRDLPSSAERTAALDGWLYRYNHHRPHAGIGRQTPITRLNNLLGTYI